MGELVSQSQAAAMLRAAGLSRRAAYYRLDRLEATDVLGAKAFRREDVEQVIARITKR